MKFPKLQRGIEMGLFSRDLCALPEPPSLSQVTQLCQSLPLVTDHMDLLLEWGGADLEELRITGIEEVRRVGEGIVFASDHNGFIFRYGPNGSVFQQDTDGGDIRQIAGSIREFIDEVFLGERCLEIYGQDWLNELRKNKIA